MYSFKNININMSKKVVALDRTKLINTAREVAEINALIDAYKNKPSLERFPEQEKHLKDKREKMFIVLKSRFPKAPNNIISEVINGGERGPKNPDEVIAILTQNKDG